MSRAYLCDIHDSGNLLFSGAKENDARYARGSRHCVEFWMERLPRACAPAPVARANFFRPYRTSVTFPKKASFLDGIFGTTLLHSVESV